MSSLSQLEIASMIDSNVKSGIKGVVNSSYSFEMLVREVNNVRNRIIATNYRSPGFLREEFMQSFSSVKVDKKKLSGSVGYNESSMFHFSVPNLLLEVGPDNVVGYIGEVSKRNTGWKVYIDESFNKHKYKPASSSLPYVFIDPSPRGDGWLDGWVFNYKSNLTQIAFKGILDNPEEATLLECVGNKVENYPIPDSLVVEVVKRLTDQYLNIYRLNGSISQPNQQTDIAN
jgi:hypothetical protein